MLCAIRDNQISKQVGLESIGEDEVGIEIEIEGEGLDVGYHNKTWKIVDDYSLRGSCCEAVLRKPIKRTEVSSALDKFNTLFKDAKIDKGSNRTSTHVHINVLDIRVKDVLNIIIIYTILEELLMNFCGEERKNNLFCLQVKDAGGFIKSLKGSIRNNRIFSFRPGSMRYAALNLEAIEKFGSVEFRGMRGGASKRVLTQWIKMLLSIKDISQEYDRPQDIIEDVSRYGSLWVDRVLKNNNFITKKLTQEDISTKLIDGVRVIQEIAYV